MSAQNKFSGKDLSGTFVGGQGPVKGQTISSQSETTGLLNKTINPERHPKVQGGGSTEPYPSGSANLFDVQGKGYAGPQNLAFKPVDKGDVPNTPTRG